MNELKFDEIKEEEYIRGIDVWLDLTIRDISQKVEAISNAIIVKDEHRCGDILNYLTGYLAGLRDGNRFGKNPFKNNTNLLLKKDEEGGGNPN